MNKMRTLSLMLCLTFSICNTSMAQDPVEFELSDIFIINESLDSFPFTVGANLAINTNESEILVVFYDTSSLVPPGNDPISGEPNQWQMVGLFINPNTFDIIGDPFVIMGNPNGEFETIEVDYNPVTNQYIAVGKANSRGTNGADVPIVSVINSSSSDGDRIVTSFLVEEDSTQNYDDVSIAVNTNNGGYLVVAEKNVDIEGNGGSKETIVGILFDQDNNPLNVPTDLDGFNVTNDGDVDDPDVQYLPENNLYFALFNTDGPDLNATAGRVILPDVDENGNLILGDQTALQVQTPDFSNPSHPSAIENPFTGEFIGAYDVGNSTAGGYLAFFEIGDAPDYILTETRETSPYVVSPAIEGDNNTLVNQRHPQMAIDENSGAILVAFNVGGGYLNTALGLGGMLFTVLGPDGNVLPANTDSEYLIPELSPVVYTATPDEPSVVDNGANNFNAKYDPNSDSIIMIYTADSFTNLVSVTITSDHLVNINEWSLY